jgi:uncharacterized membrane protein
MLLQLCRDVETNLGPTINAITKNLTVPQKKAYSSYFYPKTIKLKNEYRHISTPFLPYLRNIHPLHSHVITKHPKLTTICYNERDKIEEYRLYAIIYIIVPTSKLCKEIIINQIIQHYTNILQELQQIPNNNQKYHGPKYEL